MTADKECPYCKTPLKPTWKKQVFFRCPSCQLITRNLSLDPQSLDEIYKISWDSPYQEINETGATSSELAQSYAHNLAKSLNIPSFAGLKILDFGSGRGEFSTALSQLGANVYAIEPYGWEFLQKRGIEARASLMDFPLSEKFDGIVCIDVIEHLSSPWNELKMLKDRLLPHGWIFLATPNGDGINARINGENWAQARNRVHLMFFNTSSIVRILSDIGFVSIQRLHWNIKYSNNSIVQAKDWLLKNLRLDGELRVLARNV